MSCCSSGCVGGSYCPCRYAHWFPRVAFGLILVGYGVNHYRNIETFVAMSSGALAPLPQLGMVAGILAYIIPALMIVGGALFAVKQGACISKTCILVSLSGIIGWASLGVLIGDGAAGGLFMPMIQNAALLIVLYWVIKKMSCCGSCPVVPVVR